MTQYTTQTLLNNIVYGTPSGNYDGSSQLFYSNPVPAANYYGGQGSLQTITYRLSGFVGRIVMQATLEAAKDSLRWFDIDEIGDEITPLTEIHPVNVTGNFVWLRAKVVGFDAGTITSITAAY